MAFPPSYVYTPPTWPPPNGGAPFPGSELGPILNPYPYGSTQGSNISTSNPAPLPPNLHMGMPPKNGGNQGPGYPALPTWPWPAKMTVLPDKANPLLSQIP